MHWAALELGRARTDVRGSWPIRPLLACISCSLSASCIVYLSRLHHASLPDALSAFLCAMRAAKYETVASMQRIRAGCRAEAMQALCRYSECLYHLPSLPTKSNKGGRP